MRISVARRIVCCALVVLLNPLRGHADEVGTSLYVRTDSDITLASKDSSSPQSPHRLQLLPRQPAMAPRVRAGAE